MRRWLVLAPILFLFVGKMAAEKPFDFATTPGKLPKQVVPSEYAVRVEPNLEKLTFTGSETIKLEVHAPVRELVLNAADIAIRSATLDGKTVPANALKIDTQNELLRIALASELAPGKHELRLSFSGKVNQQGRGLYYMPYQEEGTGAKKTALGTQFEATDARRFFPCWDEPSFRARFQLTAVIPENWTAVSNMPVELERKIGNNRKEVRFALTPSMSSYLNVFVAGELDMIATKAGTELRVVTTKGKAGTGRYALESTAQILDYYNDYFGVPYPLPKLDQIAIPGGFGGAMENWGGITYFETALLFDPQKSSESTRQIIYEVIAHEVAHQWFGDLVTMGWWDNLWLNEGFASWMGSKCTARFNPQWEVWLQKVTPRDPTRRTGISKELEMEGDARSTTHPIQQPITNEAEANSAFDDITYRKGQAFLVMLESFLGEDAFRDGIRRYIAAHKYSNSTTADLWKALREASGQPVEEIAAGWTEQPGFPVLKVKRDGEKVSLSQERFTIHYPDAPPLEWKIPLTYFVVGDTKSQSRLMTGKIDNLPNIAADGVLKLNADGAGNYRVEYDARSWKLLLNALPKLGVPDRVNLLGDAWAFAQADRAPISQYLELVGKLPANIELAEREQIINTFDYINRLLIGDPVREKFQSYAHSILRPSFDQLGWSPKKDEPPRDAILRGSLIEALGALGDETTIAGCRERFQKYLSEPASLTPDLRWPVFWVVGHYGGENEWNTLHELGLKTTSSEEQENYYDALTPVRDPKLIARTLQIALTDELPTSRAVFLVGKVARYAERPDLAWDFAKANMKALLAKIDALGANSYAPSLFTFFSDPARATELREYAKTNLPVTAAKDVAKAVDEIEFRAEFKKRLAAQLANSLQKR
ncbi:MAG TPA: M1 family metallopeptidase [Chthoniobacterales bacterium]|nr:M1 family metallopeptidase [Chthoniobacterales bacterium]